MESLKSNENKQYLKAFWWLILLLSLAGVGSQGFIGLNQGFDWSFITHPKAYLKLFFYLICWAVGYYFLFLKSNRERQALKNQSLESKDEIDDSSRKN